MSWSRRVTKSARASRSWPRPGTRWATSPSRSPRTAGGSRTGDGWQWASAAQTINLLGVAEVQSRPGRRAGAPGPRLPGQGKQRDLATLFLIEELVASEAVGGVVGVALDVGAHRQQKVGLVEKDPGGFVDDRLLDVHRGLLAGGSVGVEDVVVDRLPDRLVVVVGVVAAVGAEEPEEVIEGIVVDRDPVVEEEKPELVLLQLLRERGAGHLLDGDLDPDIAKRLLDVDGGF